MTKLTVNISSAKSEKVVIAVLNALGLSYETEPEKKVTKKRPLNKAEIALYNDLKESVKEIKLHQEGKIKLKTIEDVLAELS